MDLFDAIAKRHSYRGTFKDEPVSKDDLKRIVEAGLKAPSGCNAQTTEFVIIDDPDLVAQIQQIPGGNKAMTDAKAYIACILDKDPPEVYAGLSFQVEDCSAGVENILLAITAMGYAAVWIDGWLRKENRAETIGRLVALPEGKIIRVILPMGKPTEERSAPDKQPFEERAWFNRYRG